ncbi:MAG: hypothetical protein M1831_002212 [Alyxoria varia]|nr:MAG: hypothetical protein M1831_002212 [Alyxoria varia]
MGPNPRKGHIGPRKTITPGPNAFAQRLTRESETRKSGGSDEPKLSQDDGRNTSHSVDAEPKTSSSRSSKRASFWRDTASRFDFSQDRPRTPTSLGGGQEKKDRTPSKTTTTNKTPSKAQNKTPNKPSQHKGKKESPKTTPKKRAPTPTREPVDPTLRLGASSRNDERIRKLVDENDATTPSKQSGKGKFRPTPPPLSLESVDRTPSRKGAQSPNPKSPKHRFKNMMGLGNNPNTKQNQQSGIREGTENSSKPMPRGVPEKAAQILGTVSMGSRHNLPSPRLQPKFGALDLAGVPEFGHSGFDECFDEGESVSVEDSGLAHPGNRVITQEYPDPRLRALNERLASISSSNPQQGPDLSYMDGEVPPTPPSKKSSLKKEDTPRRSDSLNKRGFGKPHFKEQATPRLYENAVHRRRNAVVEDNADIQSMHGSFHARPPMFGNTSHEPFNLRVPEGHQAHFEDINNPFPTPPIFGRQREANERERPYSFSLHPDDSVTNHPSAYPSPLHPTNKRSSLANSKDDGNRDISDTSRSIPIMLDSAEEHGRIPGSAFPDFAPAESPEQRSGDRRVPRAAFPHFGPLMASHNLDRPSYETMTMHSQPSASSLPPYAPPSGSVPGLATAKQAHFPEPQAERHPAFANEHPALAGDTNDEGTVRRSKKQQSPSHLTTESKLQELSNDYQNASTPERAHFQSLRDSLRASATAKSRQQHEQGQQSSHSQEGREQDPPVSDQSLNSTVESPLTREEAMEFVRSHLVVVSREVFETLRLDPEAILLKLDGDGNEAKHGTEWEQHSNQYVRENRATFRGLRKQVDAAAAAGPISSSPETPTTGDDKRQDKPNPERDADLWAERKGERLEPLMAGIKKEVMEVKIKKSPFSSFYFFQPLPPDLVFPSPSFLPKNRDDKANDRSNTDSSESKVLYIANKLQREQLGISIPRLKNEELMEVVRDSPFMRSPRKPSPVMQGDPVSLSRQPPQPNPSTQSPSVGSSKSLGLAENAGEDADKAKANTSKENEPKHELSSSSGGAEEGENAVPYDKLLGVRSLAEYYTEPHLTNLAEALTSLIWDNYGPNSQEHPFSQHPDLWADSSIVQLVPPASVVRKFISTPSFPIKSGTYAERARAMEEAMVAHQQEDLHARFAAGQLRQQNFLRMVLRAQHEHFDELAVKFKETQEKNNRFARRELETWREEKVTAHIRDTVGKQLKPPLMSSIEESLRYYNSALQTQLDRGLAAVEQRLTARVDQYLGFMTGMGGGNAGGGGGRASGGWTGGTFNGANTIGSGGLVTGSSTAGYSSSYGTSSAPATANYVSPTQMIMDDLRSGGSGGSDGTNNGNSVGWTGDRNGGSNNGRVGWTNDGNGGHNGGKVGWTNVANAGLNNSSFGWASGIDSGNSTGWSGDGNVGWANDTNNDTANHGLLTAPPSANYTTSSGMASTPATANRTPALGSQTITGDSHPIGGGGGNGTNNGGSVGWTGDGNDGHTGDSFGWNGGAFNGAGAIGYGENSSSNLGWTNTTSNTTSTTMPGTTFPSNTSHPSSSGMPSTPATATHIPPTNESGTGSWTGGEILTLGANTPAINSSTLGYSYPNHPHPQPHTSATAGYTPSTPATAILDDLQAGGGGGPGFGGFSASATPESVAEETRGTSNTNTGVDGNVDADGTAAGAGSATAAGPGPANNGSGGTTYQQREQGQHHSRQGGVGLGLRLPSASYRGSPGFGGERGTRARGSSGRVWSRARQFDDAFGGGGGGGGVGGGGGGQGR